MITLQVSHQTNYYYGALARRSVQYIRMTPLTLDHQITHRWHVMLPKIAIVQKDGFGNELLTLSRNETHDNLQIQASGVVEINPDTKRLLDNESVPYMLFVAATPLTQFDAAISEFAEPFLQDLNHLSVDESRDRLIQMAQRLLAVMPYTKNITHVGTTAAEAFATGGGVCQDHAHVFISACRAYHLPARYVSGYIYDDSGNHMASHAWAEVWLEGYWYTFDISNQRFTPSHHIYIATGRDYRDAAPVRGMRIGGGYEDLYSQVLVSRLS
ncbi:transglutaminase family protein [Psychrobacter ciconiae]|uniref:transglutaminase family protein n=1 Tax=Psychrobacter ciconiae TaxID=1553449 RepID=UPI001917E401|nr:transglutaminase family protein [Psychrobacter ciconiae]